MSKGNWKARYLYPTEILGQCEMCGESPATDRHHKNGDTENNDRSNLQFLCEPCHYSMPRRPPGNYKYRGPRVYHGPKRIAKKEISARLDMAVGDRIEEIAAQMGISRNKVLALAAEYFVKNWGKQKLE